MSTAGGDPPATMGSGVDYKTLFLGACSVIVILGGAAFRIWDSGNQRDSETVAKRLDRTEERLAEMETRYIEQKFKIDHLERALERQ